MSVEIAVLNALGLILAAIENEIVAGIEAGVALFRDHTEVASVGISVHDSGFVAAETGFGGISYGPQSFALYVDPSSDALRMKTRFNAAATTVHELLTVCVNARARCAPTIGCALETFLREEWPKAWRSVFDGLSHRIIVFVSYAEQPDRGNECSVARCLGRLRFAYGLRGFGPDLVRRKFASHS